MEFTTSRVYIISQTLVESWRRTSTGLNGFIIMYLKFTYIYLTNLRKEKKEEEKKVTYIFSCAFA